MQLSQHSLKRCQRPAAWVLSKEYRLNKGHRLPTFLNTAISNVSFFVLRCHGYLCYDIQIGTYNTHI